MGQNKVMRWVFKSRIITKSSVIMMHKYVLEIISNLHLTENKKIMMIYNKLENNFFYYFHLFIFVFRTNSNKSQYATINICMALNKILIYQTHLVNQILSARLFDLEFRNCSFFWYWFSMSIKRSVAIKIEKILAKLTANNCLQSPHKLTL